MTRTGKTVHKRKTIGPKRRSTKSGTRIPFDTTKSGHRAPQDFDELISWLKERGWPVFPSGTNGIRTFCPTCEGEDSNSPSLTIGRGTDGRALLFCFSGKGCGLDLSGRNRDPKAVARAFEAFGTAEAPTGAGRKWRRRHKSRNPLDDGAREVARYDYGEAVKIRYEWLDGGGWNKDFRWSPRKPGPVLYRPPTRDEKKKTVIYVEGEKDVDRLRSLGFVATTASEGYLSPSLAGEHLEGVRVAVLRDYDKHGDQAFNAALEALDGVAAAVFPVELPGLEWVEKGGPDVSDWLDSGGTKAKLRALIRKAKENGSRDRDLRPDEPALDMSRPEYWTDTGNALRMVAMHRDKTLFCPAHKSWYVWDGRIWARDGTLEVMRIAKATVRAMWSAALDIEDPEIRARAFRWCMQSEATAKLKAMVENAQSEVAIEPTAFNTDKLLLCVENGTIDLRTGELRAHDPADLITLMAPVEFEPKATDDRWEEVLDFFVRPDDGKEEFLRLATFESATGSTKSKAFINLFDNASAGDEGGNTGKTTFLESLRSMLGPYSTVVNADSFLTNYRGGSSIRSDLAACDGKRMVVSSEIPVGRKLDIELMKKLTAGTGSYRYERKHENSYDNDWTATIWLDGNTVARARVEDHPLFDRWKLTPFKHRLSASKIVRDWLDKAASDPAYRAAVLAWVMRAREAWTRDGIGSATVIDEATAEVRAAMDPLAWFWKEECRFGTYDPKRGTSGNRFFSTTEELRVRYEQRAHERGVRAINRDAFLSLLKMKGVRRGQKRVGGRVTTGWRGVRLRL